MLRTELVGNTRVHRASSAVLVKERKRCVAIRILGDQCLARMDRCRDTADWIQQGMGDDCAVLDRDDDVHVQIGVYVRVVFGVFRNRVHGNVVSVRCTEFVFVRGLWCDFGEYSEEAFQETDRSVVDRFHCKYMYVFQLNAVGGGSLQAKHAAKQTISQYNASTVRKHSGTGTVNLGEWHK